MLSHLFRLLLRAMPRLPTESGMAWLKLKRTLDGVQLATNEAG
jgi:hypothetical protein